MPTRATGGLFRQPTAHRWSFPVRTGFTPLSMAAVPSGHGSLALGAGREGDAAGLRRQPGLHSRSSACQREGTRACVHAHRPLEASQRPSKVHVCATPFFFFFLQLPFKEGSCSHEQLTSGKMLGTLRIRWFGLLRAPHSQLVSWGTWQTGCSHQQCWRHVSGIKSISLCKKHIKI